ncbi:succinylglutamate desuccinylase/aspartoacylase domain-containing protein [Hahella ganghwensis]|uniref:succinylglutamate desuccinylase/aspartoacylase domain-containing protein n=1 Tax=Hahella ganghwensis TaxID=286420 RepID=UPI000361AD03|nr:succinylglutamate desuccinylase/aspartoacylase family protein [Hahella ganghwensis]
MDLQIIEQVDPSVLQGSVEQFLEYLGHPSIIRLQGADSSRRRMLCTLLHGNEPSGLQAVFHYLQQNLQPAVDIDIVIASVTTALTKPRFSHRMLPGMRDLNRCFRPPFNDNEGRLANSILEFIRETRPECLIDLHNTSGSGPAFAVSVLRDADHLALTSLWTNDLIVTDLRLGALMELSEQNVPTVTIECGGATDRPSLMIAREGLQRYFQNEQVLAKPDENYAVTCYRNPVRLEVRPGFQVAYTDDGYCDADITLSTDADRLNYGSLPPDEPIARLGPEGMYALQAKNHLGEDVLEQYFCNRDQKLYARHTLKLFMVTTNKSIAERDCLLYFIEGGLEQ